MRLLSEMSSAALTAALSKDSVIVLPTGAVEHHGPHLPLATDQLIAEAVAEASVDAAAAAGVDVWRLPGLAYTKSDEHHWASGTIWLGWDTMMSILVDIGRSVAATPARRLAFLNGHGGMSALLQVACREIRRRYGLQTFVLHAAVPPDQGGPSASGELGLGVHGGLQETAMILHLRPELVDMAVAVRSVPEHLTGYQHVGFGKPVSFGWLSNDFGPSGVIGDPTGATAELGAELFGTAVRRCAEALAEVAVFDPAGPGPTASA